MRSIVAKSWVSYAKCLVSQLYSDAITGAMASQITGVGVVCSTACSGADQRKYQSSASRAFVRGIHQWPMDSPDKRPVTRKMFPSHDVISEHIDKLSRCASTVLSKICRTWIISDGFIINNLISILSTRCFSKMGDLINAESGILVQQFFR